MIRKQIALTTAVLLLLVCVNVLQWRSWIARSRALGQQSRKARTQTAMYNVAAACGIFQNEFGRWPASLAELQTNAKGVMYLDGAALDGWGAPIIYLRRVGTNPPVLVSYGADSAVDGDTNDGDFRMVLVATNVTSVTNALNAINGSTGREAKQEIDRP